MYFYFEMPNNFYGKIILILRPLYRPDIEVFARMARLNHLTYQEKVRTWVIFGLRM